MDYVLLYERPNQNVTQIYINSDNSKASVQKEVWYSAEQHLQHA